MNYLNDASLTTLTAHDEGSKDEAKQITPVADKKAEEGNNFQDPYTFDFLLNRIYDMLKANNPTLGNLSQVFVVTKRNYR